MNPAFGVTVFPAPYGRASLYPLDSLSLPSSFAPLLKFFTPLFRIGYILLPLNCTLEFFFSFLLGTTVFVSVVDLNALPGNLSSLFERALDHASSFLIILLSLSQVPFSFRTNSLPPLSRDFPPFTILTTFRVSPFEMDQWAIGSDS